MPQCLCIRCGPLPGMPSQSPIWKIIPHSCDHTSSVSYSVSTYLGLSLIPCVVSFWSLLSFVKICITVLIVPNDSCFCAGVSYWAVEALRGVMVSYSFSCAEHKAWHTLGPWYTFR